MGLSSASLFPARTPEGVTQGGNNRPTITSMWVIRGNQMVQVAGFQTRPPFLSSAFCCSSSPMSASIARVGVGGFVFYPLIPFFFFPSCLSLALMCVDTITAGSTCTNAKERRAGKEQEGEKMEEKKDRGTEGETPHPNPGN